MRPSLDPSDSFQVVVVRVIDGDSLVVQSPEGEQTREIRLHGIDAPEADQPYGTEAADYLRSLALNRTFTLEITSGSDHYGRVVGILYDGLRSNSLNLRMVAAGLAYSRYGRLLGVAQAEAEARQRLAGVWQMLGGGVRPWVHRRIQQTPPQVAPWRVRPSRRRRRRYVSTRKRQDLYSQAAGLA